MIKYSYVKINKDKVPLHSLDTTFDYEDVCDEENLAVYVREPYVVLDVDNEDYFNVLCEIIKDKNIRTRILKTSRGGHFWFKSPSPLTNTVNINTPITIKVDVKSWGKKSLVTVKKDGLWRNWIKEDENIDELPFWLRPIKVKKDLYDFKKGDGRDPELFSYIIPLINNGFDKQQIREIFHIINEYVFADRLKDAEIDKMFDDNDIFDKGKELVFFKGKQFQHNVFVDWLLKTYKFKSYGKEMYIYNNGIYEKNPDEIYRKMLEQIPNLKKSQLMEAYENLRLRVTAKDDYIDPMIINVKNGLYDLRNNKFLDHTPDIFTINQLNCVYNPNVYCNAVDYMLNSLVQGKKNIRKLLEQLLGYLLIGDCRFQKAFVLLGQGANGKSKFLEMILNWIGEENCSTLALEDLSARFRTSQLVGKIANIGDDSGADLLQNTAIFKKIVTGDSLTVEFKHGQPFNFSNKAKMLFSANNLPPSSDKSDGFFRRIIIIPFSAKFTPQTPGYDPNIIEKVTTEEARSYLLNLALNGAIRLLKNGEFDIPEEIQNLTRLYEINNNTVLQWLAAVKRPIENSVDQVIYTEYCLYCQSTNSIPVKLTKFNDEIKKVRPTLDLVYEETPDGTCHMVWKKTTDENQ